MLPHPRADLQATAQQDPLGCHGEGAEAEEIDREVGEGDADRRQARELEACSHRMGPMSATLACLSEEAALRPVGGRPGRPNSCRATTGSTHTAACTSMHTSHAVGITISSKIPEPLQPANGSESSYSSAGRPLMFLPSEPHASVSASTTACVSTLVRVGSE
eukprot:3347996-Rhodomonas_salina.3